MPRSSTVRYTWTDYLSTPEDPSRRYEIVDGELFVTAAPRPRHQQVVANLLRVLADLAEAHDLGRVLPGPITVHLHDELVLEPDLVFIARERLDILDPNRGAEGPPDLVVEIPSPSNRSYDRNLKRKHYLENGVAEVWILDADEHTLERWRPGDAEPETPGETLTWSASGQSFEIVLGEVFRG